MNTSFQASERRQYYRINDSAIFSYRLLKDEVLNGEQGKEYVGGEKLSTAFEMIELFGQMNQQMGVALGRISEHSADIATYLKGLDNKIELLAQMHLFQDKQSELEPQRQINLGAGGLAFGSDEKLKQGTLLAMDMILSTDLLCLHLTGRVIQVSQEKNGDFPYRISVGFVEISETEVDQIIKHIMRLQSEHLRSKRDS
ncbi:PilZ domain-containing protein [sulfur-oxidizing endosymbiont of Gigantopelta aegis]|uniref:PilZ domain-containing protein n=1 Tax=sulfur-oxidizing endosymbiont of Gigantopelta aegis TaxID=2794934 RepID=UPI0018DC5282|nr:PilZ domain-containing protein [sulfur-oxidizing endosymbiont of Gigantopelta aegis]